MGDTPYAHYARLYGFDKISKCSPSPQAPLYLPVEEPPKWAINDPYFVYVPGFFGIKRIHPFWATKICTKQELDSFNTALKDNPDNPWPNFNASPPEVNYIAPQRHEIIFHQLSSPDKNAPPSQALPYHQGHEFRHPDAINVGPSYRHAAP